MAVALTTLVFVLFLFPGAVASIYQSSHTELAVRGLAEYLCSRPGPVAVGNYLDASKVGSNGLVKLWPRVGASVELELSPDEWREAEKTLKRLGANTRNQSSACIAELMGVLLPERASAETPLSPSASAAPSAQQPTTRNRSFTFSERNGHCAPDRPFQIRVAADAGWEIVADSVEVSANTSSKSNFSGVYPASNGEYELRGNVINSGTCGPFWRDGRGHVWGSVSFTERTIEQ